MMNKPMSLSQPFKLPSVRTTVSESPEPEISLSGEEVSESESSSEVDSEDETSSPGTSPYMTEFSNPKLEDTLLFRSVKYPPSIQSMFATTPSPPTQDEVFKSLSSSAPISMLNKRISSLNKKLDAKRQTLPSHNPNGKEQSTPPQQNEQSTSPQNISPTTNPKSTLHLGKMRKRFSATRSSSTSSLFIDSSLSAPNTNRVLRCVATALYSHISSGHKESTQTFVDIFDESLHPIEGPSSSPSTSSSSSSRNLKKSNPFNQAASDLPPRVSEIYRFIERIFSTEKLPSEVSVLSLVYIERLITKSSITLHQSNWKRVLLSALILASKVWEDQAVWNIDFLSVFPHADVADLNALEKTLLEKIQYNVTLTGAVYAKYYFELRSLAEKDSKSFPLNPMDKETGKKLEEKSKEQEQGLKRGRRSLSSDNLLAEKGTGRHVIN